MLLSVGNALGASRHRANKKNHSAGTFSFVMNSLLMNKSGQFDGPLEGPEVTRGIAMSGRWPTTWTDEDQPPRSKNLATAVRSFYMITVMR